ncbi:hypothetical protein [Pseudoxanthomonas winnipegensis]|uniref:Uncharacterized protein n=1 Tax=Pseudoxanthomonas winnipegensis TaxID=2480810 RepID=A0A4Q8LLM6_9GAMM|nr:hypothetical protein [Pseudoxanthomonas winnipegensis]RZZ85028.1 hypothetical protein EA662_11290 [Pseudoxanthomonas winnipegensis]TAA31102.1 hypothetical protein EA661_05840 [Pseudoxanthomonas winnipegensis]TAA38587.1 hypothetical protein EAT51_16535 [Pseudoxanthomonas winnipegensis]TBV77621.1 hypothetical protein EYC46_04800 [Pseudoxanthomonas winnipegensis]
MIEAEGLNGEIVSTEDRYFGGLPDLPLDREPTNSEASDFYWAVVAQVDYQIVGEEIEAKKRQDAEIKLRTQAKRAAEMANPEAAAPEKKEVAAKKAADRQRRFRERKKTQKSTGKPAP